MGVIRATLVSETILRFTRLGIDSLTSLALLILGFGVDPTFALVLSQVVLSFGIPFALVPLVWITARRSVLGPFRNRLATTVLGVVSAALLITLNLVLLWLVFTGT